MSILTDISSGAVGGLLGGVGQLAKDIRQAITGDMTSDQKLAIQQKIMDMELAATNAQMEMIKAEASSSDPWTSRARPSFMYIFYFILILLGVISPFIGLFYPNYTAQFYINVAAGFNAIPGDLYALFGAGYLGYTGMRTFEKVKGVSAK